MSGLELFGLRFSCSLQKSGNPVYVCTPENGLMWKRGQEMGLAMLPLSPFLKFSPTGIWKVQNFLKQFNPKAVITFRSQTAHSVHLAKILSRVHSPSFLFYRIGAGNHHRRDPIHRILFKKIEAVVPNSEHVAKKILKYWAISPDKVVTIRSGVDIEKYFPSEELKARFRLEAGIPQNAVIVGNTGRIHPEKGSRILLESLFAENGAATLDKRIHLVYIGREFQAGYADTLRGIANELGAEKRFHIFPFRSDVEKVYPGFDLFTLAVTSHETYAYVALEAMASGVVPLVPFTGGMKEMFTHGKEGFFFTHRDPNSLRIALKRALCLPPSELRAMGLMARKRIEETASWDSMMKKYFQLFESNGVQIR